MILRLVFVCTFENFKLKGLKLSDVLVDLVRVSLSVYFLLQFSNLLLDFFLAFSINIFFVFDKLFLNISNDTFSFVGNFDCFSLLFILFSFFKNLFDFFICKTSRRFDSNISLSFGSFIYSSNINDSVHINIETDFNLRNTLWCWRNINKFERSQKFVIFSHITFSLEDFDIYFSLTISSSGEHLRLFSWDGSILWNQSTENSSLNFNTQSEWSNINQHQISETSFKNTSLNSSSQSNRFIRINSLKSFLSVKFFDYTDNFWSSGHTSDQKNFVDIRFSDLSILQASSTRFQGFFNERIDQFLILSSSETHIQVKRLTINISNIRNIDRSLNCGRQFLLGFFSSFT